MDDSPSVVVAARKFRRSMRYPPWRRNGTTDCGSRRRRELCRRDAEFAAFVEEPRSKKSRRPQRTLRLGGEWLLLGSKWKGGSESSRFAATDRRQIVLLTSGSC